MATYAFVGPLAVLRRRILEAKHAELDRIREQIRVARADVAADGPQLANSVAYYQLVESVREWPVDAANLLKFLGYLTLGLASWVGGALVEQLLGSAIGG